MGIFVPSITVITSDVTVTVGVTGDFTNLNDALAFLRTMQPVNNAKGFVTLLSGFVLREQIIVDNRDLSWITISAQDASVTCDVTFLTPQLLGTLYPLFVSRLHSALPIINFNITASGTLSGHSSACAIACSSGGYGKLNSSKILSGFQLSIYAEKGAFIDCSGASIQNTKGAGLNSTTLATIEASSITVNTTQAGAIPISVASGGKIQATAANLTAPVGTTGVNAFGGDVEFSNGVVNGGATSANDLSVSFGGIIRSSGSVAGSSVAFNTLTANGIIFR